MTTLKAADLPVGSVVADQCGVWFKDHHNGWLSTGLMRTGTDDMHIDWQISRGAQVLRVGDGGSP